MKTLHIIHHPARKLFTLLLNEKDSALISYELKNNVFHLIHSEIPFHLRGQGIGKVLIQKVVEYLVKNKQKGKAVCSYIRYAVKQNQAWQKVINL